MAPRAIWKGSITFGLITIPVGLYSAIGREQEKFDFHLLHEKDGSRIHYERTCDKGHEDIDWGEIVKGYEYSKGKWVTITDEDLDALELESLRTIDVVTFAPDEQIDPIFFDKSYYMVPEEQAVKAYRLIVDALEDEHLVGVCKVAIREREHLAAMRVKDGTLVLQTMHWPEEVRAAKFDQLKKKPKIDDRERKMARQLIQHLSSDFDPKEFTDEYHKALKKLIDKKIAGEEIVVPPEPEPTGEVVDLMEALRASVEAARQGKKPQPPKKKEAPKAASDDEDLKELSKQELLDRAKELDIAGRSKMAKPDLVKAIEKAS
ncbi:MAG TPA: Ku protein [Actinomycetota bacterium]|nr:Ku protein [Actinomycetota bacterium]